MKKIVVNQGSCIGCGACVAIDSEHFAFSDEGLSTVISQEATETSEVQNAMESCPTGAINYGEEENNENPDLEEASIA